MYLHKIYLITLRGFFISWNISFFTPLSVLFQKHVTRFYLLRSIISCIVEDLTGFPKLTRVEHLYFTFLFEWFLLSFSVYLFILLYNIVLVLPYIDLNPPWVCMCSPSWTPLPPPSPSHPSGSSQCTSPEHPVSCIKPGLAIHFTYDNIHVSMPLSHIILPLPSPTESNRLFNTSVSLLLSHM